jgi:hypothetical protein
MRPERECSIAKVRWTRLFPLGPQTPGPTNMYALPEPATSCFRGEHAREERRVRAIARLPQLLLLLVQPEQGLERRRAGEIELAQLFCHRRRGGPGRRFG